MSNARYSCQYFMKFGKSSVHAFSAAAASYPAHTCFPDAAKS